MTVEKFSIRCFWFSSLNPFNFSIEYFPLHEHFRIIQKWFFFLFIFWRFSNREKNRKAMNKKKNQNKTILLKIFYIEFVFFFLFSLCHCFVVDFNFTHRKSRLVSIREKLWQVLLEIECLDIVCLAIRWIWQVERKQLAHPAELTWAKTRTSKLFIYKHFMWMFVYIGVRDFRGFS